MTHCLDMAGARIAVEERFLTYQDYSSHLVSKGVYMLGYMNKVSDREDHIFK